MKTWLSSGIKAAGAIAAIALVTGCGPSTPEEFVAAAKKDLAKNDRPAAVIQLRNALQKNPDFGEARYLLGQVFLDDHEPLTAEKELRKAVTLEYAPNLTVPALARTMLALGQNQKLLDEFGNAELGTPDAVADLRASIGLALLAQGNSSAAQAALAAAHEAVPGYARATYGEARIKADAGELEEALKLVETALAKMPLLSEGWLLKGGILAAQGRRDDALTAYRKAIDADRKNYSAHSAAVSLLMSQGKADEAVTQLDALKKIAPSRPETLYLQAWIAFNQKNYAAANEAIQRQLKVLPDNIPGLMLGGAIDLQLKAYAQAEAKLTKALRAVPRNRLALRLLVSTYVESGQSKKAVDALTPILPAIEKDADMLALAGMAFMQTGDVDDGIAYFEKAAALDPESTGKRTVLGLAHLAKGDTEEALVELEQAAAADSGTRADLAIIATYLRQRQVDKALAAIDALEKKDPKSPVSWNLRGGALMAKNDKAGARRSFERALELDPINFGATASLARIDLMEKNNEAARKRFETLLAKDPKNARAHLALARMRAASGASAAEVGAMIAKAVEASPTDASARLALVEHYIRNKDGAKAVAAAQDALVAFPNSPRVLEALARAHRIAGDNNQAIKAYHKLAEVEPGSPLPFLRIAELQVAAKENDKALESLRQALGRKPDYVDAQRAIIALDLRAGRLQQAVAVAKEIQKQRPKQSLGWIFEGDIHASKKSWGPAVAAYRAGLDKLGTADLAIKLDSAMRAAGSASEADKFAAGWVKDHPKDGAFRLYLAQSAVAKKEYAKAAANYTALAEARPKDPFVLNNLAWTLGQMKDPRALEYAEKAYTLMPNSPNIMDTLGTLLVEKGETKRGVELLRKATELAPDSNAIRMNLAKALLKEGQKDAAKKELETLEKLGDRYPAQAEVAQLMKGL